MLTLMAGKRRLSTDKISFTAAPVGEVTTPIWPIELGIGCLLLVSNRPSAESLAFNCSNWR